MDANLKEIANKTPFRAFKQDEVQQYLQSKNIHDINIDALTQALNIIDFQKNYIQTSNLFKNIKPTSEHKKFIDDLKKIEKHAKALGDTLNKETVCSSDYNIISALSNASGYSGFFFDPVEFSNEESSNDNHIFLIDRLKRMANELISLEKLAQEIRKNISKFDVVPSIDISITSEAELKRWLICKALNNTYTTFFKKKPQVSNRRGTSNPYGEGLDFFSWCFDKMNISIKPSTIVSYYHDTDYWKDQ